MRMRVLTSSPAGAILERDDKSNSRLDQVNEMPDQRDAKFRELLSAFRREVQGLVMVLNTYRYLQERRVDYLEELNRAPAFFQTVFVALRTTWVVRSYSLLAGTSREAGTITKFLKFVGENLDLFSKEAFLKRRVLPHGGWQGERHRAPTAKSVRLDIERVNRLKAIKGLKTQRHKYYGHLDPEYFMDPGFLLNSAPLDWGDLEKIQSVLTDILNKYSEAFDGEEFIFKPENMFDVQNILDALRRERTSC